MKIRYRKAVLTVLLAAVPVLSAGPARAEGHEPQPVVHEDPVCAFDGTACAGTIHVVARGEWLWKIARAEMSRQGRSSRDLRAIRVYVAKIYSINVGVIGHNPDRLRVGTRLILPSVR